MNLKIRVKQLGSRRDKIGETDFPVENKPETVGELITECVKTCVQAFNGRIKKGGSPTVLTEEQIENLSETGKIAFGINYNGRKADLSKALETALQAYEDGLFRIFINDEEAGGINDSLTISDSSVVTFVKLTMLAGRLW